jgi:hypothetical protein
MVSLHHYGETYPHHLMDPPYVERSFELRLGLDSRSENQLQMLPLIGFEMLEVFRTQSRQNG